MPSATDSTEEARKPQADRTRWAFAVLAVVAAVLVGVAVASRPRDADRERDRDPLELADDGELRQVVVAVSQIILSTTPEAEDRAIRALEGLRPRSPGAADLRDSCVSTYRGTHDAVALMQEGRRLLPPDGGEVSPDARARLDEISHRTRQLVTEARESQDRCVSLYQASARRLRLEPARRPRP